MTRRAAPPKTKKEAEEWHGEGEVQQCRQCGGWYSKHSPAFGCHACAVGMELYKGPDGPSTRPLEASQ